MYAMEKFGDVFSRIEYVQTFNTLRTRYNQHQDKIREREKTNAAVERWGKIIATSGVKKYFGCCRKVRGQFVCILGVVERWGDSLCVFWEFLSIKVI